MILQLNCLIRKFVPQITKIKSAIVLKNKLPSFTFIEMIFSLLITIVLLSTVPLTIKIISQYKQIALENSSIEFELFHSDLLKEQKEDALKPIIKDKHTLHLINKEKNAEYIFKNNKIYKQINGKGNITLLNQVSMVKMIKSNDNIIKIILKVGNPNYNQYKTLFL
ncbi:type IV pilus minor pilin ComGF family protein [Staphylococcus warneri]|uniref:competence type IV pilus minor pilin ComGF n=2 Tax=Staphylococcus warneri TaxID=1292 RepID=UPI003260F705